MFKVLLYQIISIVDQKEVVASLLQEISATYLEHDGSRSYDERVTALGVMKLDFVKLRDEIISRILVMMGDKA